MWKFRQIKHVNRNFVTYSGYVLIAFKKNYLGVTRNYWWRSGLHCGTQIWPETYIWIKKQVRIPTGRKRTSWLSSRMFKKLNEGLQLVAVRFEIGATELKASVLNHYNASRPVSITSNSPYINNFWRRLSITWIITQIEEGAEGVIHRLYIGAIYHHIDRILISSSNLVNASWVWRISRGAKQKRWNSDYAHSDEITQWIFPS